jgi:parvulin-like peptidyl-prolyl isomerase
MFKNYKKSVSVMVILYLLLFSNSFGTETIEGIAAIVGPEIITISELSREMHPFLKKLKLKISNDELKKIVLDQLINKEILLQKSKQKNITITEAEIQKEIASLIKLNSGLEKNFWAELYEAGWTKNEKRQNIKEGLMISKFISQEITRNVKITRQEVADFYKKNISAYKTPEIISMSQIVLKINPDDTKETIHSKGTIRLESMSLSELSQEIATEVSKLKVGEISNIIKTPKNLYIFKLESKQLAQNITLSVAEPTIKRKIINQKRNQKINEIITEEKKKNFIKINI